MKLLALSLVSLLGVLSLQANATATASTFDVMRDAALSYSGQLPCSKWDCDCAYKQQHGCCCVAEQAFALEENTVISVLDLWDQLTALEMETKALTENIQISFTAAMPPMEPDDCFGPFTTNIPIPYASISLNHGNGYNSALGVFTAPRAGIYVFSFTTYSNVGTPGERLFHKVQLMKNSQAVASMWEDNREDTEDSGTQVVVLEMRRGCQVYMQLVSGRRLCGNTSEYNKFSGFLLYPLDEE